MASHHGPLMLHEFVISPTTTGRAREHLPKTPVRATRVGHRTETLAARSCLCTKP